MLRIHRDDLCAAALCLSHHQFSGADQGFLVGKADSLSSPNGGQRGLEAQHSYHRCDDCVGLRQAGSLQKPRLTGSHADVGQVRKPVPQLPGQSLVGHHGQQGPKRPALRLHPLELCAAGQRRDPESQLFRHVQGLPPDGAGGAQDGNHAAHAASPTISGSRRRRLSARGATKIMLSNRSKMPP